MKKFLIALIVVILAVPAVTFAIPSSIDRIVDRIEPLIKTDYIKATFFVASSTTGTSTFAGRVAIGTTTPFSALHINGNQPVFTISDTAQTLPNGVFQTQSSNNRLSFFSGILGSSGSERLRLGGASSQTAITGALSIQQLTSGSFSGTPLINFPLSGDSYFNNGGRLGVGTTSPAQELDVAGDGLFTTSVGIRRSDTGATVGTFAVSSNGMDITSTNGNGRIVFNPSGVEAGRFSGSNFGIGTNIPDVRLHVQDGNTAITELADTFGLFGNVSAVSDNVRVGLIAGTQGSTFLDFGATTRLSNGGIQYNNLTSKMGIFASSTERLSILGNGNVGIATTAPTTALSVVGTTTTTGLSIGSLTGLLLGTTGSVSAITTGSNGNVLSVVGGVPAWVATSTLGFTGGGGGGSGTVNSGTTGQIARYNSNGTAVTGTSTIFIADNGNVGIGTTTDIIKLFVEGNNPSNGYTTAALKNSANDGRSQMTFSAGSQDYYAGFIGMSGSTVTNYPNTMEVGCGFSGCGMNFWSDGFLQSRMGLDGNWGFGTTTDLNAKLTIVGDSSIKPLTILNTATNTAFTISTSGLAVFGTSTPAEENGKQSIVTFQGNTGDDAYTTFTNTASGKSMAMRIRAASNFVHFDIISSGAAWLLGQFGGTNFAIRDDTTGTEVFSIAQGLTSKVFDIASTKIVSITGALNVNGSSTTSGAPIANFYASTGSTTMAVSQATTTLQHASTLSGFLQATLARVSIGIDATLGYLGSGKFFGALNIAGLFYQEDWNQVDCSVLNGAVAISADGVTGCDGFAFYEDGTATLTSTANGGNIYSRLSTSATADGAGVFLNAPTAGGLFIATSTPVFQATARIHTVQNQGTTTQTFIGFTNLATAGTAYETAPTAGCFFTASTTIANWQAICRTSLAANTTIDTGVASTTVTTGNGVPYRFMIETGASKATFYIQSSEAGNLTQVADITTNVPNTVAMNAGVHFGRAQGVTAVGVDVYDMNIGWRKVLAR